jgi:hypothetical protein
MDNAQKRRVFEETIAKVQARYAPSEDVMVEAQATGPDGLPMVVARYKLYVDGHWECFQVLNDVLWPDVSDA